MDEGPLVRERIEAGLRFVHEFDKYAPVCVAFWLKKQDGWFWHLHIVSDQITDANFDLAYREVIRLADQMADPDFNWMRVTVLGVDEPLGKAALEAQQRYKGKALIHIHDSYFGGIATDGEIIIYPQSAMVSAAESSKK